MPHEWVVQAAFVRTMLQCVSAWGSEGPPASALRGKIVQLYFFDLHWGDEHFVDEDGDNATEAAFILDLATSRAKGEIRLRFETVRAL